MTQLIGVIFNRSRRDSDCRCAGPLRPARANEFAPTLSIRGSNNYLLDAPVVERIGVGEFWMSEIHIATVRHLLMRMEISGLRCRRQSPLLVRRTDT